MQHNNLRIQNKLHLTTVTLYLLTLVTLVIFTAFALKQNWNVRLETRKSNMVAAAHISNVVLEDALIVANNRLASNKRALELALMRGTVTTNEIQKILNNTTIEHSTLYQNHGLGIIFYVDKFGIGNTANNNYSSNRIDLSDRFYFRDLKENLYKSNTIGPIVKSRTTGQWLFHMSVPLKDSQNKFAGVIVQQLLPTYIYDNLSKVIDKSSFEKMQVFYPGSPLSFNYPEVHNLDNPSIINSSNKITTESSRDQKKLLSEEVLAINSESEMLKVTSHVTFPIGLMKQEFIEGNLYTFIYASISALFVTALFIYLYRLTTKLNIAQNSSLHDSLTGLYNRRAFEEQRPILLRESMRNQAPLTVLFIDIDYFSIFNAKYGHKSGDEALKLVANALSGVCQRPLDFICRWGGEEFVAILPNTSNSAATKIAHDMLEAVRNIRIKAPNKKSPLLTVSIGHITHKVSSESIEDDLVGAADEAMLQAKNLGRNKSVVSYLSTPYRNKKIRRVL